MSLMSVLLIQGGVLTVMSPHHQHTILNGKVTHTSLGLSVLGLLCILRVQILYPIVHKVCFASFSYVTNF